MKIFVPWAAFSAVFAALAATPASAEAVSLFAQGRPVSNESLDRIRGGTAPFATMSRNQLATMTDANARSDFRFVGASGQYQMDIWWSTVGLEIIAQTARAATMVN